MFEATLPNCRNWAEYKQTNKHKMMRMSLQHHPRYWNIRSSAGNSLFQEDHDRQTYNGSDIVKTNITAEFKEVSI